MTVCPPGQLVLVTGGNGYIAVWLCRLLLEQGYSVRGTVRADSKGTHVKKLFDEYGEKFECVVVEDITKDGAFDNAVKDVDAVIHMASPVSFEVDHPDGKAITVLVRATLELATELIKPAVQGTLAVLNSIVKSGSKVRRVVITSSVAALVEPHDAGYVYTEADWNEFAINEAQQKAEKAAPDHKYQASKTLAEKAAWDFAAEHKDSINWELVTILPHFVFGPLLQEIATKESMNFSSNLVYQAVIHEKPAEELHTCAGEWVDVRDVALAHVLALQKEDAGGERIIVSAGAFTWQDLYDGLNARLDRLPDVPLGKPGAERPQMQLYSTKKEKKILGLSYRSLGESAHDTVVSARERVYPAPVTVGEGPAGMTLEEVTPAD